MLSIGLPACGSASKGNQNMEAAVSRAIPSERSFLGDGDGDNPRDVDDDGTHNDGSEDHDDDSHTRESYNYHDGDDGRVLDYGSAAGTALEHAVATVATRYYAAVRTGDGSTACALIVPGVDRSAGEDYGGDAGPAYLRGAHSCPAVIAKLSAHFHTSLAGPSEVTSVRVDGDQARAFIGSPTKAASYMPLQREGRVWRIEQLLGNSIP